MFDYDTSYRELVDHFNLKSLKGFGCDDFVLGISAAGALLKHLKTNLISNLDHVYKITPSLKKDLMNLDVHTIKNLEIFNSLSSTGSQGTLIDCIDSTLTSGGGRLLRSWLINPITNIKKINTRLLVTEAFVKNNKVLNHTRSLMKNAADLQRLLGKISSGKIAPREIIAIALTIEKIDSIKKYFSSIKNDSLEVLSNSILETKFLSEKIKNKLNDPAPVNISKGGVIVSGFNRELDDLRKIVTDGKEWINNYQEQLRFELGIPKLKINYNRVFGYYIEVSKINKNKVPDTLIRKQTLVNSERYITHELKEYEKKLFNAEEMIFELESDIFHDLCRYILTKKNEIQINAQILNRIDVLLSFAYNAIDNNYSKPVLTEDQVIKIKKGRHPVVEKLLPITDRFISNSINMDCSINQIHLLTGPNMAGKSTYLRQIGLISLMAHIGSYVPAEKAKIGIIDHLFTRVGASDNLAAGESTFLVEMNEAANILNNATKKSLVLLDEIGRGTSTYDGLSIAWAITEYLHNKEKSNPRTIFATHYHELTNLESTLPRLENHHVEVKEFKEEIIFIRSIAKGAADRSYGIHVAKMAGVPKTVIDRAEDILITYSRFQNKNQIMDNLQKTEQVDIFSKDSKIKNKISELDIENLTPIDALLILKDLKNELNS
jgi:DNA mismatch repair protein MutS